MKRSTTSILLAAFGSSAAVFMIMSASFSSLSAQAQSSMEGVTLSETHIKTQFDNVPRLCNTPYGAITHTTVKSGNWNDVSVWNSNSVPGPGARIHIDSGKTVTHDVSSDAILDCIEIADGGVLQFVSGSKVVIDQGIWVLPGPAGGGTLTVGTKQVPIPADKKVEIVFADTPLNTRDDPQQFGKGLLVWGVFGTYGAKRDPTFTRLTREPTKGDTTLELETAPVDWRPGDRLVIPGTTANLGASIPNSGWESNLIVKSISNKTVTLQSPLQYTHRGARDVDGNLRFLPHVGNLTRNIVIRSASTDAPLARGHIMLFNRALIDMQYTQIDHLGRTRSTPLDNAAFDAAGNVTKVGTNQIGRYPLHAHRLLGPRDAQGAPQFSLVGNVVLDNVTARWGIVIHASHYGLITKNIVFGTDGSHIVAEDGSETGNVFDGNFMLASGPKKSTRGKTKNQGGGPAQSGFWARGVNNAFNNNVAVAPENSCIIFYLQQGQVAPENLWYPRFPGADPTLPGEGFFANISSFPVRSFKNNEVYACNIGFESWDIGATMQGEQKQSLIENLVIWHVGIGDGSPIFTYNDNGNVFDRLTIISDMERLRTLKVTKPLTKNDVKNPIVRNPAFRAVNRSNAIIRNADIQGTLAGVQISGKSFRGRPITITVEDSTIAAYEGFIRGQPLDDEAGRDKRVVTLRNVTFRPLLKSFGIPTAEPEKLLNSDDTKSVGPEAPQFYNETVPPDYFYVYDHNGERGKNFQIFWKKQAPNYVIPERTPLLDVTGRPRSCPTPGFTNQQCWDAHKVAYAGNVAPCPGNCEDAEVLARDLGVDGFAFSFVGNELPQPPVGSATGGGASSSSTGGNGSNSSSSSSSSGIGGESTPPRTTLCIRIPLQNRVDNGQTQDHSTVRVGIRNLTTNALTEQTVATDITGKAVLTNLSLSPGTRINLLVKPRGYLWRILRNVSFPTDGTCLVFAPAIPGDFRGGAGRIELADLITAVTYYRNLTDTTLQEVYRGTISLRNIVSLIRGFVTRTADEVE